MRHTSCLGMTGSQATVAAILAATIASQLFGAAASAKSAFDNFPLVITCENKGTEHAYYLSRVTEDGIATFVASDRIAGTITVGGPAKAVGGTQDGGSCVGKTLQELRAAGQAHDLK